jgi:hypothetical protein
LIFASILGFIGKIMHIEGSSLVMIFFIVSLFFLQLIRIYIEYKKNNTELRQKVLVSNLFYISLTTWAIYYLFRVQFWAYTYYVFTFACIISFFVSYITIKLSFFKWRNYLISLITLLGCLILNIHAYTFYYWVYMNPLASKMIKKELLPQTYDKYSYFLFLGNCYERGRNAEETAINLSKIMYGESNKQTILFNRHLRERLKGNLIE